MQEEISIPKDIAGNFFKNPSLLDFRKKLQTWFQANARPLPWRKHPTPYTTVVSEFMLQQTRISTVFPYFQRWMAAFPDFATLAQASPEVVMQQWAGLGYYARARHLQATAQQWLQKPPHSYADLQRFPGIGPYTAAAIASLLWNEPIAVVDGNVVRVLARFFFQTTAFPSRAAGIAWARPLAQALLDPSCPGMFNEALMECGEQICLPARPHCSECPFTAFCQAFRQKSTDTCPRFVSTQPQQATQNRLWIFFQNTILLEPSSFVGKGSLWEMPALTPERQSLFSKLQEKFRGKRSIGNTIFTEIFYQPAAFTQEIFQHPLFSQTRFFSEKEWKNCALSSPHRRWLTHLLPEKV